MKYKIGDVVRILNNTGGHRFSIGDEVTIIRENTELELEEDIEYLATDNEGGEWYILESCVELAPKKKEISAKEFLLTSYLPLYLNKKENYGMRHVTGQRM